MNSGLKSLSIKNFAIINDLKIDLSNGLNIFTGETGAGKSIIVESLNFLFGARAYSEMIKENANFMEVQGIFNFSHNKLKNIIPDLKEENISIKRIFDKNGKSKSFINNKSCNLSILSNIGKEFLDFHAQNENQSLLNPLNQIMALDNYCSIEKLVIDFSKLFEEKNKIENLLKNISLSKQEKDKLIELYSFQLSEIENLKLKEGEDEELEEIINRLKNAEKINKLIFDISSMLKESENSVLNSIYKVLNKTQILSEIDSNYINVNKRLDNIKIELEDISSSFSTNIQNNSENIDFYITRQEKIKNLKKKYGQTISEILKYAQDLKIKISELENINYSEEKLNEKMEEINKELKQKALELHNKRVKKAKILSEEIENEIKKLGFEFAKFTINIQFDEENFTKTGGDSIEFLFTSNPDIMPKPLKFIASGGELSRIMLAIKSVITDYDKSEILVFDEIDSGVGGNTIFFIGEKLKKMAKTKQILCITHMAQLAAFGDSNFKVEKNIIGNTTEISVKKLNEDEKIKEISRMLGSKFSAKTATEHARELVKNVKKYTKN